MEENKGGLKENVEELSMLELGSHEANVLTSGKFDHDIVHITAETPLHSAGDHNTSTHAGKENCSTAIKKQKRNILKNVFILSLVFLLVFNSFIGLTYIQSSLQRIEGMGTVTQGITYTCFALSSLMLPKLFLQVMSHKRTMFFCFLAYIIWMVAYGYPVWETMIPASVIVGLASAPVWTAASSYLTKLAAASAELSGEKEGAILTRYFGIFFAFIQISSLTGSVISSFALSSAYNNQTADEQSLLQCGKNHCPKDNETNPNLALPHKKLVWTMVGIYTCIAVLAVILLAIFLDSVPTLETSRSKGVLQNSWKALCQTCKQLLLKKQLLLCPLDLYLGVNHAMLVAEFSKAYVACSLGTWKIGLINAAMSAMKAIASYANGHLTEYVGHLPIVVTAVIVDLCIQITCLTWMPNPHEEVVLYILGALWGLSSAIWKTQCFALYGIHFPTSHEAAFSCLNLIDSTGHFLLLFISHLLCTDIKFYILTSFLLLTLLTYLMVEWVERKYRRVPQEGNSS